jgi:hypothetical protein
MDQRTTPMAERSFPSPSAPRESRRKREIKLGAGALLLLTLLINIYYLYGCGDGLSRWADGYSEAGSLRGAEGFTNLGFFQNCGLSDVSYGHRYPEDGLTRPSGIDPNDTIYHGYPPGSEWITAVQMRFFGAEHPWRLRIFPTAFGMAAATIFLLALIKTIGAPRALFVYLVCLLAPMFTNMTHSLYYHGYAFGLLLVQVAMLLVIFASPRPLRVGSLLLSFALGFVQGWLSFDYCFVVTFAAIPIALLIAPRFDRSVMWTLAFLVVASGLGFGVALGLHFLQSAVYFGSIRGALAEYAFRSHKTYAVAEKLKDYPTGALLLRGLIEYGRAYLRWTQLFSPASIIVTGATLAAVFLSRASFTVGRSFRLVATFAHSPRILAGIVSALVIGLMWLFAKPFHAFNHLAFVGRHLFLFYFGCAILLARTSVRTSRIQGKLSHR